MYAVRGAVERRLRREVDDASVFAAFFEIRRRCAAGIERAVQIDAHDARPVLIGNILDQRLREHARAVHQNVDAAQRLRGLRHKPVNIGGNGDIRLYRDAAAPHRGDLFPELLRLYGEFASIREAAANLVRIRETVDPVAAWIPVYQEKFELFRSTYRHLKPDFPSFHGC